MPEERGSSTRLWIATLVFVAFVPATVIVYIPYWLTRWNIGSPFFGLAFVRWLGVLLILAGLPVFVDFLWRFVQEGRGTPAP